MYHFTLYYDQEASYQDQINPIIETLRKIQNKWETNFNVIDIENLQPTLIEQLKSHIRSIPPQIRGKIVSAKNNILPFSKNKNLNTTNTPILILYHNEKPINVYPHMLGTTYFDIKIQLEKILENGPEAHMAARGLLEEPIQKIVADDPSILEKGIIFKDANIDVGFGVADMLLQDSEGKTAVVEIETKATEKAVAQVSRLAAGYASQSELPLNLVRKIILCQQFEERTVKACQGANVELYKLAMEKIC